MMISLCKDYWQLVLAQGVILGIGNTLLLCPALAVVGRSFKKRLAFAVGVTISGSSLGGVVWPVIVHVLLQKPNFGFGWTLRTAGFIMIPILGFSCVYCQPPSALEQDTQPSGKRSSKESKVIWDWSVVMKETIFTSSAFFVV